MSHKVTIWSQTKDQNNNILVGENEINGFSSDFSQSIFIANYHNCYCIRCYYKNMSKKKNLVIILLVSKENQTIPNKKPSAKRGWKKKNLIIKGDNNLTPAPKTTIKVAKRKWNKSTQELAASDKFLNEDIEPVRQNLINKFLDLSDDNADNNNCDSDLSEGNFILKLYFNIKIYY